MTYELETAEHPEKLRRVAIDPVSRVEGHGKVTILLDEDDKVHQVRLHIVEFRGFERFIQGRPYWEVPVMVQRLCGICPVSHHLAASKALDAIVGAKRLTPTAEKMRRLMHYGQMLQSHALHFFHLCSPDLLFGFDSEAAKRNIVGVAAAHPETARQGVLLRKFGQEVIRVTAGKRVHGTGSIPGGVNKTVTLAERDALLADVYDMLAWCARRGALVEGAARAGPGALQQLRRLPLEPDVAGRRPTAGSTSTTARLRARDDDGGDPLRPASTTATTRTRIREEVKPWSYMKFPFLAALGAEKGWYKVGPLAARAELRPHPHAARRGRAARVRRLRGRRADPRAARLPLGAHDRDAARGRDDQGPAARRRHPRRRPRRRRASARARASASSRRRAAPSSTTTAWATTTW